MPQTNPLYRDHQRQIEFDRVFAVREIRAQQEETQRILTGEAVVFDSETEIGGWFREVIRRGAFDKTIREFDQVALWSHDPAKPMARRSKNTLELWEDNSGLQFRMTLGEQSWSNDAWISVQRGDVQGMSFGFRVIREAWTDPEDQRDLPLREILEAKLYEISPVAFPAYPDTSVEAARSIVEAARERGEYNPTGLTTTVESAETAAGEDPQMPAVATTVEPAARAPDSGRTADHSTAGAGRTAVKRWLAVAEIL